MFLEQHSNQPSQICEMSLQEMSVLGLQQGLGVSAFGSGNFVTELNLDTSEPAEKMISAISTNDEQICSKSKSRKSQINYFII